MKGDKLEISGEGEKKTPPQEPLQLSAAYG